MQQSPPLSVRTIDTTEIASASLLTRLLALTPTAYSHSCITRLPPLARLARSAPPSRCGPPVHASSQTPATGERGQGVCRAWCSSVGNTQGLMLLLRPAQSKRSPTMAPHDTLSSLTLSQLHSTQGPMRLSPTHQQVGRLPCHPPHTWPPGHTLGSWHAASSTPMLRARTAECESMSGQAPQSESSAQQPSGTSS